VSGGNRREIDVRALPDFGRPRGFNILAAVPAPKISGNTSRALRARAKVSFVHAGFSRSAFWGLGLRFISFDLAFVGLAKSDHMRLVGERSEHPHMQSISDLTQCMKAPFTVVLSKILDYQRAVPLEFGREQALSAKPAVRPSSRIGLEVAGTSHSLLANQRALLDQVKDTGGSCPTGIYLWAHS
jgi:hypothetical protein